MAGTKSRDHGGGLDAAIAQWGGTRDQWLDLSTGINPVPYPLPEFQAHSWTALPDKAAQSALTDAARSFWNVPDDAAILAAPGASSLIARIPTLYPQNQVDIPQPTYNEHAAAFRAQGWDISDEAGTRVLVHPNNPTGHLWTSADLTAPVMVIDESFCDIAPEQSLIAHSNQPGRIILKSFGKFWGLAGLRLGFLIGAPDIIARMQDVIGPWAVSGPALEVGIRALTDHTWASETRARLSVDCIRLDALMTQAGAKVSGGCDLFRLYDVTNAAEWQDRLCQHHILSRIFPYSDTYLRLGLPTPDRWTQLENALKD
ncbi:MAG: threonine-phosphate decarboxylase [Cognatishimia sp.]